jgi:hypothetical protein
VMPSNDTIDWNACIVLRACEWLAERGREHHDAPRQLARVVAAWCIGKAAKRDVADAFAAMQLPAQTDDRAWSGVRHAAVALAYMVLGRERAINAAVVQVETALSWVFDPEAERCYATVALEQARSLVGQWSRERDESKRPA